MGAQNGQMLGAQFENASGDLTPTSTGLVYFNTSTAFIKYYNGSSWKTVVDTDSIQTITNKYTSILRGGASASGNMELRSTDHATKSYVGLKDGSSFLVDNSTNPFVSLMTHFNQTNPTSIFAVPSTNPNTIILASNITSSSQGAPVLGGYTSRGTFASPSSVAQFDVLFRMNANSWASTTAQDFIDGQALVGWLGFDAGQIHTPTARGTRFSINAIQQGTTTIHNRILIDSDGSLFFGSPTLTNTHFLWFADGGGNIGAFGTARPANIFAATAVRAPSLVSDATVDITTQGTIRFYDATTSNYMGFRAPNNVTADKLFTLPDGDGTVGQVMATDGSQTLSWVSRPRPFEDTWLAADGATKTVTHNLNTTRLVSVSVYDTSAGLPYAVVFPTAISIIGANSISITAAGAPATSYAVVVTFL